MTSFSWRRVEGLRWLGWIGVWGVLVDDRESWVSHGGWVWFWERMFGTLVSTSFTDDWLISLPVSSFYLKKRGGGVLTVLEDASILILIKHLNGIVSFTK